jgi:hypothetical protein
MIAAIACGIRGPFSTLSIGLAGRSSVRQQEWFPISPHCPAIALQQACSSGVSGAVRTRQVSTGATVHINSSRATNVERAFTIRLDGSKLAGMMSRKRKT